MAVAQGGELGQHLLGPAEGERRGQPCAAGFEAAGLPPGRLRRAVRQVREGRSLPEGQRVVQDRRRLGRVAVGQRARPLAREAVEAVQVDVVRCGAQLVAAVGRGDGLGADGPAQAAHERLQRAGCVGGRVAVPHLVDEYGRRDGAGGTEGEDRQERAQP
ncbi:hypothetical protein GCM10010449_01870 [Streptomyces rectiviolaceus]|uniref:Uncharacterized protein n=1 Tax=Streptomyces rectiviolaceus TaxID=332591 RepID=A0ABP6M9B3_9ACTN